MPNVPVVYFAQVTNTPPANPDLRIKIGYASNFQRRLSQHRAGKLGVRVAFDVLCVVRGGVTQEGIIKRNFAGIRWEGEEEVFRPEQPLVDYVRWLRNLHYAYVPDDPMCPPIENLELTCPSRWLPSPDRTTPPPAGVLPGIYGPMNLPPRKFTSDDFYTNDRILKCVRGTFGGQIELDPASHPIAQQVVKASQFFTIADDGLAQPWTGKVWLNPPFSQWPAWIAKILGELHSGNMEEICVLTAARTTTAKYFHPLIEEADAVCMIKGRIPFWGSNAGSPDDGHYVFYIGPHQDRFRDAFNEIGTTYYNPGKSS